MLQIVFNDVPQAFGCMRQTIFKLMTRYVLLRWRIYVIPFVGDGHCQTLWITRPNDSKPLRVNGNHIRARCPYKGQIMPRCHRLARVQWARRHFVWRRADWKRFCSVTNPELHFVILMAELGFIAAQTSVMRIAACWKGGDLVGTGFMVWRGIMGGRKTGLVVMLIELSTMSCVLMSYSLSSSAYRFFAI